MTNSVIHVFLSYGFFKHHEIPQVDDLQSASDIELQEMKRHDVR
jgi:hypothetical protein